MSQLQKTMAPATAAVPAFKGRRSVGIILGAIALTAAFMLAATVVVRVALVDPDARTAGITDGWMHGTAALSASNVRSAQVTDGWAARYLPSARASQVTDGWAGRYLPSASSREVTDGWASRYLPSARSGE